MTALKVPIITGKQKNFQAAGYDRFRQQNMKNTE